VSIINITKWIIERTRWDIELGSIV